MQIFSKSQINEIALAIKSGKAAILPTDTVWAIASVSEQQIYAFKKRAPEKKVIKFIGSVEELELPSFFADVLKEYWPGALSVIWKGISYRIPGCSYLLDLLKLTGPLYQSSANISGKQPIKTSQEAFVEFKPFLERMIIIDNSPYEQCANQPSTIINLDNLTVVREGPINGQEIIDKLKQRKEQR